MDSAVNHASCFLSMQDDSVAAIRYRYTLLRTMDCGTVRKSRMSVSAQCPRCTFEIRELGPLRRKDARQQGPRIGRPGASPRLPKLASHKKGLERFQMFAEHHANEHHATSKANMLYFIDLQKNFNQPARCMSLRYLARKDCALCFLQAVLNWLFRCKDRN